MNNILSDFWKLLRFSVAGCFLITSCSHSITIDTSMQLDISENIRQVIILKEGFCPNCYNKFTPLKNSSILIIIACKTLRNVRNIENSFGDNVNVKAHYFDSNSNLVPDAVGKALIFIKDKQGQFSLEKEMSIVELFTQTLKL